MKQEKADVKNKKGRKKEKEETKRKGLDYRVKDATIAPTR